MNKKGFTLIELLAIIIVIAIVAVIAAPNIVKSFNKSKEKSYTILINNIKVAGENYYLECENGDLSDTTKYAELACSINNNTVEVSLGQLEELGILKANSNNSSIINPKNKKDISMCNIIITKVVGEHSKTTFSIEIPEEECFNN